MCRRLIWSLALACLFCLLVHPVSALYDMEGIPLRTVAQGTVQGDVLVFGLYGLQAPPATCTFSLDREPAFARIYMGVWGGTEQYRGWAQVEVNGAGPVRYDLYGKDDRSNQVYAAGHGVYWIAQDATGQLGPGSNTVTVTTSRGDPDNKLDGRVYAVLVVVADDRGEGPVSRYWLAEGNENLHGEGWAGTNPTRHDNTSITFDGGAFAGMTGANLTIFLLASARGQPDYVLFNGGDLGIPASPADEYPPGARDIGDERSFDAAGGAGVDSRYVDAETFDVTAMINAENTVEFQRGRDSDGDGAITTTGQKPEGEDYIHSCLALLVEKYPASSRSPDFAVKNLRTDNAYTGREALISGTVWNSGFRVADPAEVVFSVDNVPVKKEAVTPDSSGKIDVSAPWPASSGSHTVSLEISHPGDSDKSNNRATMIISVGTPPALDVRIDPPYHTGGGEATAQKSPWFPLTAIIALLAAYTIAGSRKHPVTGWIIAVSFLGILAVSCAALPGAASAISGYSLPIVVINSGGSDAPPFDISVYIDGEKTAVMTAEEGLAAQTSKRFEVQMYVSPGPHALRVVVDEAGRVSGTGAPGAVAEKTYEFP